MSLDDTRDFIGRILSLPLSSDLTTLDAVLSPSSFAEARLRKLFATDRDQPRLKDMYLGLVNMFSLPENARVIRSSLGRSSTPLLLDTNGPPYTRIMYPHSKFIFPLHQDHRKSSGQPFMVASLSDFQQNFHIFTSGVLQYMDWSNVAIAGGAVLASLSPVPETVPTDELGTYYHDAAYRLSDIDIFIFGLTESQAAAKIKQIFEAIKKGTQFKTICVRRKHTITILSQYPFRPVQIVLRLYKSPAEILAGFDIDCACLLYNGKDVYGNPRAITALMRQCNTIDLSRRSPSYEYRLLKYSKRGFEVYAPSLLRHKVDLSLYRNDLQYMPKGLGRLLVLEAMHTWHHRYTHLSSPTKRSLDTLDIRALSQAERQQYLEAFRAESWYDSGIFQIPYGPQWNATRIEELLGKLEQKLHFLSRFDHTGATGQIDHFLEGHYHGIFVGTMSACLGTICEGCPAAIFKPQYFLGTGEGIQGPLKFITNDPGRQMMSGSFYPIDNPDANLAWESDAYVDIPQPIGDAAQDAALLPFMDVEALNDL